MSPNGVFINVNLYSLPSSAHFNGINGTLIQHLEQQGGSSGTPDVAGYSIGSLYGQYSALFPCPPFYLKQQLWGLPPQISLQVLHKSSLNKHFHLI